jgi:hypothetical protein
VAGRGRLLTLEVFVHALAAPVLLPPGGDPDRWARPVRAMQVVMIGVLVKNQSRVPLAGNQHPVQALRRALAILYRSNTRLRG